VAAHFHQLMHLPGLQHPGSLSGAHETACSHAPAPDMATLALPGAEPEPLEKSFVRDLRAPPTSTSSPPFRLDNGQQDALQLHGAHSAASGAVEPGFRNNCGTSQTNAEIPRQHNTPSRGYSLQWADKSYAATSTFLQKLPPQGDVGGLNHSTSSTPDAQFSQAMKTSHHRDPPLSKQCASLDATDSVHLTRIPARGVSLSWAADSHSSTVREHSLHQERDSHRQSMQARYLHPSEMGPHATGTGTVERCLLIKQMTSKDSSMPLLAGSAKQVGHDSVHGCVPIAVDKRL
jgi:hypothetical protein